MRSKKSPEPEWQERLDYPCGLGIGGSYNWNNDTYSIYGEASVNTSLANFADSYTLNGTAGVRVKW